MQRDNLVRIEKTNVDNSSDDYSRCVRLLAAGEDMSHPHGRYPWMGKAAHLAIFPVPLSRQTVSNHWEAGTRSMGAWNSCGVELPLWLTCLLPSLVSWTGRVLEYSTACERDKLRLICR
jgi:hypothetical protein